MTKQQQTLVDELPQLMQEIAGGNRNAFNRLYHATRQQVYAYLHRLLQDKDLVDDVFTETYTEVWKSAGKFKAESRVSTWIIGISRNLAMNNLKRLKHHDNLDDYSVSGDDYPDQENEDYKKIVHNAIKELPENHREILGLILLPEFSYKQISEILDVPLNTVKTRIYYAKDALKQTLIKMGVNKDVL
jgi:RNA polymerase sigma-70 factor, ECF subfamily